MTQEKKTDDQSPSEQFVQAAIGTLEEGLATVGRRGESVTADFSATEGLTQFFLGSIEDGNPSYWDEEFAQEQWGGLVAPMGLLSTLSKAQPWRPGGVPTRRHIVFSVPLPGESVINASSESEFFRPIMIGDKITSFDEIADISAEKTTRLGVGHFVSVVTNYLNQDGELIAKNTNSIFRFTPHQEGDK